MVITKMVKEKEMKLNWFDRTLIKIAMAKNAARSIDNDIVWLAKSLGNAFNEINSPGVGHPGSQASEKPEE